MRFDDTLQTVLATDTGNPAAAQSAWRQLVDLIGRGRAPADEGAIAMLAQLRDRVPVATRAASARALFGAQPPASLVEFFARDSIEVAAPILRGADLTAQEWQAILPGLTPAGRAVLRHRRDLPQEAMRALEAFGSVDFVIPGAGAEPAVVDHLASARPFVTIGDVARDIVGRARRRDNDDALPPPPAARADGTFRIADVVARIEAYRRRHDEHPVPPAAPPESFRFETDAQGAIRWVEGIARGALIGLAIGRPAVPGDAGVDGAVAGAFRQRARFTAGRLLVAGTGEAAGDWTIAGIPLFDDRSGRFLGYRGAARRPRRDERARIASPTADALRQLVHELRTPTNAIAGFSEMIERQMLGPVAEAYRAHAEAIRNDAGSLLAAIDDLDTAAKLDSGALVLRREAVALAPILDRIQRELGELATARGALLTVASGDTVVEGDAGAIERMLSRLIAAMLAPAARDEAIRVRVRRDDGLMLRISVDRPAALARLPGDALLTVSDEDSAASLLGLGFTLRLVRNLAAEQGGTLRIGERRLTLSLPAAVDRPMEWARQG